MEKLVSVLWKPEGESDAAFGSALRSQAAALLESGAMQLRIDVADEHVEAGARLRIGPMDPAKAAVVSYWLHEADARGPIEARLFRVASRVASFLVVESEPIRNTQHVASLGERTPGFNLVTCIEPKPGMTYADFLRHWQVEHRATASETQSTFAYVRNEIVRAFAEAPPWVAIVEESFPIGALTDPMVFYAAEGSPETLKRHTERMLDSVSAFLALHKVESHPMSEYVFER